MSSLPAEPLLPMFAHEQFRMRRLQVYNWGTFSGLHEIPISERGFLFVGPSGSGKSTLLDAFSALLVPPRWIDFNAAARETERSGRDRGFVSYIRGAWADQKDVESGEIATQYLRPGTTWSALGLSYENALNQRVVLVHLLWMRGNSTANTDVKHHYLILERPFDLRELKEFDLDIRKLKQSLPDVFARDEFRPYAERFSRLLGIESEMALKLLHKTQSAKNLGDLNTLLRDFMLDKPDTFDVADRLVNEFAELNAAHQAVVTAREQVQMLVPARNDYNTAQELRQRSNDLNELRLGIDAFRETRRMAMLEEHIETLQVRRQGLSGEILQRQEIVDNHASALRDLEQQHRAMGGDLIERWEAERTTQQAKRDECLRKLDMAQRACTKLGWTLADTPGGFAELVGQARQEIEGWQQDSEGTQERRFALDRERTQARSSLAQAEAEVAALRRQPSNISANMLDVRRGIASALGLPESALPFAGELIQVRARDSQWQGAIERVLHGFALSLLVDEDHYAALSGHVNAVNLGQRLVYYRCGRTEGLQARHAASNSLVNKLDIKDCEYSSWLRAELAQRYDYACVDSLQAFRSTDRAITRQGQVRHSRTRHEKDDRRDVNDRRFWVLGFDNREKLALFEEQTRGLRDTVTRLDTEITRLLKQDQERAARAIQCQTLANMQWQEIDVGPVLDRIATLEQQLREAREGNAALREMSRRIEDCKQKLSTAEEGLREVKSAHSSVEAEIKTQDAKLRALQEDARIVPLTPHQARGLEERFTALGTRLSLDNLDELARRVERGVGDEIKDLSEQIHALEKAVESCFTEFKRRWLVDAADTDTTIASAPDYLARLLRLETDGLPAHEQRFFELLRNQSHQNLAALSTHLSQARKAILERMGQVNESLRHAPFNPGTHLHIDVSDRQLPEVRELRQEIQQALSHAWADDQEGAEARFIVLRRLVERLASQDPEQRRWRESVLDVRQHVEFIGQELDENGAQVEVYRSGAGKSGGQRQKLATTCLAAALRYQLGSNEQGMPIYAPVVLDEAFDKADNEFTALAMNIFVNFGFQMIVATPLKSVMTLEPFIGGACFVEISERRRSAVLLIEYDESRQRLKLPEHARGATSVAIP
jgi:uncharacterized protein YPO0396